MSVHHDHSQTADSAKFTLVPIPTPHAIHACTLLSLITVVVEFISRTLNVIRVTLKAQWYVDDILGTVLLPFLLQYSGLIFQQDNAKPYTTRVAVNCITAYQILTWPARSPDPSPIKHVWNMMGS
ncbi:transposable element Tc1 transposase [Trichonephila clavipes]|nr:transposable element Tc1 transposase [Trichonephila clavipes]